MSDISDFITAAAVAYVEAYWKWRNTETRLNEARECLERAQDAYNDAYVRATNGKAFLLEAIRKHQ